jgi:hypothetical protein
MADRVLLISWKRTVVGREERGLEVFNEAVGLYGRKQQEGKIEGFDVSLLIPNGVLDGYIAVRGSTDQLALLQEDEEYQRNMVDASLIVEDLAVSMGYTNEGVARQMEIYQDAVTKVPQTA